MRLLIIAAGIALSGCATTWTSDYYHSSRVEQQRFPIESAHCQQVARGSVPTQPIPIPDSGYQSSQVSGAIYGANGQYLGSYSGRSSTQSGGLTSGFANGLNIGNTIADGGARKDIYRACMMELGWRPV